MKLRDGTRHAHHATRFVSSAFTLIELILVMTVLTIAVSITAPALANFFHGRTLDSEARRLLALTRQGQSRAISEGIPMELWVDAARGAYGLEAEPSYETTDPKAVEFALDNELRIEAVSQNPANNANGQGPTISGTGISAVQLASNHPNLPKIRFLTDGRISESSPQSLRVIGRDGGTITLAQSRNRLSYEITNR